jgi:enoyl-CoA hydratase/carnithine racemase
MGKPVIAAINGSAVGAGFDLACACDIRIASDSDHFMAAYIHVDLFPGYGGTWLYPRLLGSGKAAEWMFTGSFMEVDEAKDLGFLNDVVPRKNCWMLLKRWRVGSLPDLRLPSGSERRWCGTECRRISKLLWKWLPQRRQSRYPLLTMQKVWQRCAKKTSEI